MPPDPTDNKLQQHQDNEKWRSLIHIVGHLLEAGEGAFIGLQRIEHQADLLGRSEVSPRSRGSVHGPDCAEPQRGRLPSDAEGGENSGPGGKSVRGEEAEASPLSR